MASKGSRAERAPRRSRFCCHNNIPTEDPLIFLKHKTNTNLVVRKSKSVVPNMSLVGVHPRELHSHHGSLSSLSYSLDDIASCCSPHFNSEHVMTIEELRLQMSSCFTCGVSWAEYHVSLDCSECGGYALERPCPKCEGSCGAVWKRELTKTHASSKAHWEGECKLSKTTSSSSTTPPETTKPQAEKISPHS